MAIGLDKFERRCWRSQCLATLPRSRKRSRRVPAGYADEQDDRFFALCTSLGLPRHYNLSFT
ncbi:hypothetical protein [Anabaena azotica]|uniref:Uncharacterized protein n=1 Tax=Anabaena azotica FACHB-119 TaxID=947527 RepID=A0ABR8D6P2_9NOST|nr:hypothetical protein [Anabaena azotica]MBD2502196.1 hypothetical protein [Anabaena azotica FACHB-119]